MRHIFLNNLDSKSKKNLLGIIILIFSFSNLMAQQEGYTPNAPEDYGIGVFTKSPDAAAISKFIDIPSTSYNGVVSFSIPIYTIETDGYQIPISIDYQTSGIKLGEISSRVGLGWSLNIGGVSLSKQVVGTPDTNGRPIVKDYTEIEDGEIWVTEDVNPDSQGYRRIYSLSNEINGYSSALNEEVFDYPNDMEPDIFSYGTLNGGGHFIFDSKENRGIPIPFNQKIIQYANANNLNHINITDEKGVIYYFSNFGRIRNLNNCVTAISIIGDEQPDYRIEKIEFRPGNIINFNYQDYIETQYITSFSTSKKYEYILEASFPPDLKSPNCISYNYSKEQLLNKIEFEGGNIIFIYGEREDIVGERKIEQIIVKNSLGEIIKNFNLNYEYFDASNEPDDLDFIPSNLKNNGTFSSMFNDIYKRLKLISVKDNLTNNSYLLEYYEDNNKKLPNRLSSAQDYWGVYNGKPNKKTPIATTKFHYIRSSGAIERLYVGVDKSPNFEYGVIGNLKKITYPTGGFDILTYEPDDYYTSQNIKNDYLHRQEDLSTTQNQPFVDFSITGQSYEGNLRCTKNGESEPNEDDEFSYPPGEIGNSTLKLIKLDNQVLYELGCPANKNLYNALGPGNYRMELIKGEGPDAADFNAKITYYDELRTELSNNKKIGTLRISKIEKYDNNLSPYLPIYTKKFYYNDSINQSKSSGINHGDWELMPIKRYQYPVYRIMNAYHADVIELTSTPGFNLTSINGKSVGYSFVTEKYFSNDSSENYITQYSYNNDLDDYTSYSPYDVINVSFRNPYSANRGQLEGVYQFNSLNNLVRSTEFKRDFNYLYNASANMYPESNGASELMGIGYIIKRKAVKCGYACVIEHNYKRFDIKNAWTQDVETKTTDYFDNGTYNVSIQKVDYSLTNPPIHTYPTKQSTFNSLNENIRTEYEYPQDRPNDSNMNSLIAANKISEPVVTRSYVDNQKTSESLMKYGVNLLPTAAYSKKGTGTINPNVNDDLKITYDRYDDKGNLQQYTLSDGAPVSIIWGYNGQYPIAKVEGLPYSAIQSKANNLINQSNNGTLTVDSFEALRKTDGALVTCYLYKPLVGVTEIIHPNGLTEYYEYDAAGRLKTVKDHNGNVLKEVDYNYQSQQP